MPVAVASVLFFGCAEGPGCVCVTVTDWEAVLSGSNVIPPASTTASGEARFWLDENNAVHYAISVVGVTTVEDARLYSGAPNEVGTPRSTFCAPCTVNGGMLAAGRLQPQGTTMEALLTQMRAFGTYVEIRDSGAGLLRGHVRNVAP